MLLLLSEPGNSVSSITSPYGAESKNVQIYEEGMKMFLSQVNPGSWETGDASGSR